MQVQRVEVQHQRWCRCRGGAEVVQKWNIGGTTEVEKRWCWCRGAEVGQRCRGAEVCDV